jgi:hypothetical protein
MRRRAESSILKRSSNHHGDVILKYEIKKIISVNDEAIHDRIM